MRIRQVRPEFFTDATMAALSPAIRLTYIGLWCVADDAGFFRRDIPAIGAVLFPFESVKRRERSVATALEELRRVGRVEGFEDCDCARIPTLPNHQRSGGQPSYICRDRHRLHTTTESSVALRTERNVTVGNGNRPDEGLKDAFRRRGLPVDA